MAEMKVLITGASGQVGRALFHGAPPDADIYAPTRTQLDISDPAAVRAAVAEFQPMLIFNAAAYTAVDEAESKPYLAAAINTDGPRYLALAALALPGCRMVHVSSAHVFDGRAMTPYKSGDRANPLSVYGQTRLLGERAVFKLLSQRAVIVRTAWVYTAERENFLTNTLRSLRERGSVKAVADQRGTPTSADSIAVALWAIARNPDIPCLLHWTDGGVATWYEFAVAIAEEGHSVGLPPMSREVIPMTTTENPTPAHRPMNSVLDCSTSVAHLGLTPPPWRANLRAVLAKLAEGPYTMTTKSRHPQQAATA